MRMTAHTGRWANAGLAAAGTATAVLLAAASLHVGPVVLAVAAAGLLAVVLTGWRAGATVLLLPLCLLPHGILVAGLWVSASDVLVVVLGVTLLLERTGDRDRTPLLGPLTPAAVGFVLWTAASSLWADDRVAPVVEAVQRFDFVILGAAVLAWLPGDGRHVHRTLVGFVAGSAVLGAVTVATGIAQGRYFGVYAVGMHKNTIGYLLPLGLLAAVALAVAAPRHRPAPPWLPVAVIVVVAGLVVSGSRGGWVGAVAGLAVVAGMRRPHTVPAVAVAGTLLVGLMLVAVPFETASDRLGFDTPNTSANVRAQTWQDGVDAIASSPLLGVGAGNFRATVHSQGSQVDPNNLLLLTWAETGVPGLLLLLGVVGGCLALAWRQVRCRPRRGLPSTAALAGSGMLVTGVVHAQFDMFWSRGTALATFAGVGLVLWAHRQPTDDHMAGGTVPASCAGDVP